MFLDCGAAVNAEAGMRGNLPMVQLLLGHGAGPKLADSHGKTALAHAREEGYPEIAALLHQ